MPMRRFLLSLLLFALTFQSVWGGMLPASQVGQGAVLCGGHLTLGGGEAAPQEQAHFTWCEGLTHPIDLPLADHHHHHHHCVAWGLLPDQGYWGGASACASGRCAEPLHAYRSAHADRIERPKWLTSL